MTHRPYNAEPEPSPTPHHSNRSTYPQSRKQLQSHETKPFDIAKMPDGNTILHIVEILGVFVCAHHFWPKGITYGEAEDWEKKYRKHPSRSKSSKSRNGGSSRGGSSSDGMRRRDRGDRYGYGGYDDVGRRYSRRASARY